MWGCTMTFTSDLSMTELTAQGTMSGGCRIAFGRDLAKVDSTANRYRGKFVSFAEFQSINLSTVSAASRVILIPFRSITLLLFL